MNYPANTDPWTSKADNVDTVLAADPNNLQNVVSALEVMVGSDGNALSGLTASTSLLYRLKPYFSNGMYTSGLIGDGSDPASTGVISQLFRDGSNISAMGGFALSANGDLQKRNRGGSWEGLRKATINLLPNTAEVSASGSPALSSMGTTWMYSTLDFDPASQEVADFNFFAPDYWVSGRVVSAVIEYMATSTSGSVVWGVSTGTINEGSIFDVTTFGYSSIWDSDTVPGTNTWLASVSAGLNIGTGWTAGKYCHFRVGRKATSGSDTLASDAKVLGVKLIVME